MKFREFYLLSLANDLLNEDKQKYIDPITGKNWRYIDRIRQLEAIVQAEARKGVHPSRIWVTFSSVPKLGAFPGSAHSEPHGVFAYPASYVIEKKGRVPYAGGRTYMIPFKVKGGVGELGSGAPGQEKWQSKTLPQIQKQYDPTLSGSPYEYLDKMASIPKITYDLRSTASDAIRKVGQYMQDDGAGEINTPEKFVAQYKDMVKSLFVMKLRDFDFRDLNKTKLTAKVPPHWEPYKFKDYGDENKDYSFEEIAEMDPEHFSTYGRNLKNADALLENPGIKDVIKQYVQQFMPAETSNIKIIKKLSDMAKEMGIDISSSIKMALRDRRIQHGTQFIYAVTGQMAKQWARQQGQANLEKWAGGEGGEKIPEPKWQMKWNQLLRKLGIHHVVDTKNSGMIHANEPTQGVFMDTGKIEPVGIIHNKPGLDPRFINQGTTGWTPRFMKPGFTVTPWATPGMPDKQKTIKALNQKILSLASNLEYSGMDDKELSAYLTMLIKMIKSLNSIDKTGLDKVAASHIANSIVGLEQNIQTAKTTGDLSKDHQAVEQKLKMIKTLLNLPETPTIPQAVPKPPKPVPGTSHISALKRGMPLPGHPESQFVGTDPSGLDWVAYHPEEYTPMKAQFDSKWPILAHAYNKGFTSAQIAGVSTGD